MMQILELFAGIGGLAEAVRTKPVDVHAVDISQLSLAVYRHNFSHPARVAEIATLPSAVWDRFPTDLWWMSPPCQPFTRRGRQADVLDPRTEAFLAVVGQLARCQPRTVVLENVPEFEGSQAHARLMQALGPAGYQCWSRTICPTELGYPNRRRRFYLVASRERIPEYAVPSFPVRRPLAAFLSPSTDPAISDCLLSQETAIRYRAAIHVVDRRDEDAVTHCFTASYGRMHTQSGSYLREANGVRRFTPDEVKLLLGFSTEFTFPPHIPLEKQWSLLGNSLSVPVVRLLIEPWLSAS